MAVVGALQGVDRKARDLTEESVLHHAASQARLSVLKTLLSFNDPAVLELLSCQNSVGDTPLHCAASIGSTSCVRVLLKSSGTAFQLLLCTQHFPFADSCCLLVIRHDKQTPDSAGVHGA